MMRPAGQQSQRDWDTLVLLCAVMTLPEASPGNEQGTYLHPELFSAAPERGVAAALAPAAHEQKSSPAGQP
ncbi:MAG TPA: hypothetical protein VGD60_01730 [Candidatus Acidoferrales bacterium]